MKVGDIVFLKKVNNLARGEDNIEKLIIETKISKIGSKYFYIEGFEKTKFSFEEMRDVSEYCACYEVYLNKQDIYDEYEINDLKFKIRARFNYFGKKKENLEILRQISKLLELS